MKSMIIIGMTEWCTCLSPAAKGDGFRLDPVTGIWCHNQCMKPTKLVWKSIQKGTHKPQCPKGVLKNGKCSQRKAPKKR
jgi:hypothetical protein